VLHTLVLNNAPLPQCRKNFKQLMYKKTVVWEHVAGKQTSLSISYLAQSHITIQFKLESLTLVLV